MSSIDMGNLIYLVLMGAALVAWMFFQNREGLGKKMQYLVAWGLIFIGVIAAIGLWDDIRQTVRPQQVVMSDAGRIELPRSQDGHYYVTLEINSEPVFFVVDTGATNMVLTKEDAARIGLTDDQIIFFGQANTANGVVQIAPVRLDHVVLGPYSDRNVQAYVNSGEMEQSLLGMSYLQRFDRLEISNGRMVLER